MKTKYLTFFLFLLCFAVFSNSANAEDLKKIVSLSGHWKFSIGDDNNWSTPSFDDSDWDQIIVPGKWEDQGYNDYNGYAWYRKTFEMGSIPENTTIYLMLGRIDDVDVVYLNGKEIGSRGKFPPNYETAYNNIRRYTIPADLLKEDGENVVAVKVYDSYNDGGIVDSPTGLYIDGDIDLLDLNLSGKWKFHTGNNKEWKSSDFDDANWKSISVPSAWEDEGYEEYDGYAWYRTTFRLPDNVTDEELYLSLGKIDDIDDVYLNGELIGNVYDLRKKSEYRWFGWEYRNSGGEYNVRRIYKINNGLLKRHGINTLAIRVYDGQGAGGIYEGPIGIMSADNYRFYRNKHQSGNSFWDYVYDKFVREW
jgi:hypothetical protein